jgi:2-phosphosulfolactate phosphatase
VKCLLNVYVLPQLVQEEDLVGGTTVVIDVLRSSTTIAFALEAGAKQVIPCPEVEEAFALAGRMSRSEILLGGERHGLPIEGFDLGNSPEEYTPQRVSGKTILFTSTNGCKAIVRSRLSNCVLIGAFVNASAVCRRLYGVEQIHLLCSGTNGEISQDDVLLAGMLVERLQRECGLAYQQNAQAITAREFWLGSFFMMQAVGAEPLDPERLAQELRKSLGARRLLELGLDGDILAAAEIDRFQNVPELVTKELCIRLTQSV